MIGGGSKEDERAGESGDEDGNDVCEFDLAGGEGENGGHFVMSPGTDLEGVVEAELNDLRLQNEGLAK